MERASNKADRLLQLEYLLLAHPQGLRRAEIARRLGVHPSTVGRDIDELSRRVPIWEDGNLLGVNRDDYLTHVRLTIHESMALHLAARLMATRTDKHNPHAAAALRKLGTALEKFSPQVSRHLLASADVMDDQARRHDPVYLEVLETLTRAWSQGRKVRLWYQKDPGQPVNECIFAPYFIEPYGIGQTAYVIGWRDEPPGERTFKLERIRRIEMSAELYQTPPDFDPHARLAGAWGIWYTEGEPERVVLKFYARVVGRVKETQWLTSEEAEEQPDGSLLWQAQVAEPREMKPWIRGWGPDCEVLEPAWLREEIAEEMRQAAGLYQSKFLGK
jgi:CRISPR-associated endonuclease/helicase Cas3